MVAFPSTPTVGQVFQTWQWDGTKWIPTPRATFPQCGWFGIVGASPSQSVQFVPYKGDLIKINGLIYHIPAAGITAVATSCFVNGVTGALTAGGTYFVYVFNNGGVLALDFSLTGHVASTTGGNVGTEIKSGDDTRTLVGIVRTSGTAPSSNSFSNDVASRLVRPWFNRQTVTMYYSSSATGIFGGQTFNCYFVNWAGEAVTASASCSGYATGAALIMSCAVTLNGSVAVGTNSNWASSTWGNVHAMYKFVLASDGFNYWGQQIGGDGVNSMANYYNGSAILSGSS